MRHLTTDATVRLDEAGQAVERIVNGTPEESGDAVWEMVERAKCQWAIAGDLAGRVGISAHDVLSIMRVVDEAVRDGRPASWAARWVDNRRLNAHGAESTARVVAMVALALGLTLPTDSRPDSAPGIPPDRT